MIWLSAKASTALCPVHSKGLMSIDKNGIWFHLSVADDTQDYVGWIWPHCRKGDRRAKWFSLSFETRFHTLKTLRQTWELYTAFGGTV